MLLAPAQEALGSNGMSFREGGDRTNALFLGLCRKSVSFLSTTLAFAAHRLKAT